MEDKRESGALFPVAGWEEAFDGACGAFFFSKCVVEGQERDTLVIRLPGNHPLSHDGGSPIPLEISGPRAWAFDGNREAPTLSPSVHVVGHWHGWIRAGRFESC